MLSIYFNTFGSNDEILNNPQTFIIQIVGLIIRVEDIILLVNLKDRSYLILTSQK